MKTVSVIMPVYNVERYVEASLLSVINQSYDSIECIIIDDSSTDNSMKRIQDTLNSHDLKGISFKIIHHSHNRGLSAARNTGLENATGEYLFFLDSDDTISSSCIENHIFAVSRSKADFSVGDIHLVGRRSVHVCHTSSDVNLESPLVSFLSHKWTVSACNKLYKSSFIKNNGLQFRENLLFEDILWSFCVAKLANNICLARGAIYNYIIHENSITRKKNCSNKITSMLYIIQTITNLGSNLPRKEMSLLLNYSGRLKFNAALLLLNYDGSNYERSAFYLEIKKLPGKGFFNDLLYVNFVTFRLVFKPVYSIYKYLTSLRKHASIAK